MQNFFTKLDSPQDASSSGVAPPPSSQSNAPWWLRYGSKVVGFIGGIGDQILHFRIH